jgi:cytochrome c
MRISVLAAALITSATLSSTANAFDEAAAKAYAKQNDCFKCHAPDKTKKADSYKKISEKYKGKADAEEKLIKHLTTATKVKFKDDDGKEIEEEHKALDKADMAKIKNIIAWIRSH